MNHSCPSSYIPTALTTKTYVGNAVDSAVNDPALSEEPQNRNVDDSQSETQAGNANKQKAAKRGSKRGRQGSSEAAIKDHEGKGSVEMYEVKITANKTEQSMHQRGLEMGTYWFGPIELFIAYVTPQNRWR